MNLPELKDTNKYVGLYVVDFGDHSGVGFTAEEVAELLESEKYRHCKVYKIHRAYPDGRMELKGVPAQTFQLEAGMFFYSDSRDAATGDFERLVALDQVARPPCRAKAHLCEGGPDKFVVALVYPAEYDDEVSSWLLTGRYKTAGPAEAGTGAVQRYYDADWQVLDKHQFFGQSAFDSRTGQELFAAVKLAAQR